MNERNGLSIASLVLGLIGIVAWLGFRLPGIRLRS